ncbi:MAG: hydroxymethylbilane synthase [Dehalococcoidia bacterium]|nr:hydroxymethylbilane synthase [Dehalococcoidia bacterium]
MNKKVIIGTRGSKLALIQAETVRDRLTSMKPGLDIQIRKIITEGDRNQTINIEEAGKVGIFVKALEEALIKCEIDIAVHSLKDLPVLIPRELALAATIERIDPRDVLVGNVTFDRLKPGAYIGTSSVRRYAQIKYLRPDLKIAGIRGNIDTRLRKLASGNIDGLILAAAAMLRMGKTREITEYLEPDRFIPAAGQGALGIEIRLHDNYVASLVENINHRPTWQAVKSERAFIDYLGGGCSVPISCLATETHGYLKIIGMVSDREGENMIKDSIIADADCPEEAGRQLAEKMLKEGAEEIVEKIRCR